MPLSNFWLNSSNGKELVPINLLDQITQKYTQEQLRTATGNFQEQLAIPEMKDAIERAIAEQLGIENGADLVSYFLAIGPDLVNNSTLGYPHNSYGYVEREQIIREVIDCYPDIRQFAIYDDPRNNRLNEHQSTQIIDLDMQLYLDIGRGRLNRSQNFNLKGMDKNEIRTLAMSGRLPEYHDEAQGNRLNSMTFGIHRLFDFFSGVTFRNNRMINPYDIPYQDLVVKSGSVSTRLNDIFYFEERRDLAK